MRAVLDTNVIYAALHSQKGASFAVLRALQLGRFEIALSTALCLEYEDVLLRRPPLPTAAIADILDGLAAVSHHPQIYFRYRPQLRDPADEHVLELALNGHCSHIVTYNLRDFAPSQQFGITTIQPAEFLNLIGGSP